MKRFTSLLLFAGLIAIQSANGQVISLVPEYQLVIEEQSIAPEAQSLIDAALGAPGNSYRLYVELESNWELQIVYGDLANPLSIQADNGFYQNTAGGISSLDIEPDLFAGNPALAYDSWLTIGADSFNENGLVVLPDLTGFDAWEAGNDLFLNGLFAQGVIFATEGFEPQNSPDTNGRILIAQLTAAAPPQGCVNMQFRKLNPDGTLFIDPETTLPVAFQALNTCFAAESQNTCAADIDNSGAVDIADMLALLAAFGCSENCNLDLTGSGNTGSGDLLLLLAAFGETCNS